MCSQKRLRSTLGSRQSIASAEKANALLLESIRRLQDQELESLWERRVRTPYEIHLKTGMPVTKAIRSAGEARKLPGLFLSKVGDEFVLTYRLGGGRPKKKRFDNKKKAQKLGEKIIGQLRDDGDTFVVDDGVRFLVVEPGDSGLFTKARRMAKKFFVRSE